MTNFDSTGIFKLKYKYTCLVIKSVCFIMNASLCAARSLSALNMIFDNCFSSFFFSSVANCERMQHKSCM